MGKYVEMKLVYVTELILVVSKVVLRVVSLVDLTADQSVVLRVGRKVDSKAVPTAD